nr:protein stabilized1 [Tanacetum cinerariifolium]
MCLVRECWTGLHEMAMAAFESQYIEKWLAGDVLARHILQELYPAIFYSEEIWLVVKLEFENKEPVKREGGESVFEVMVDARSARG